MCHVLVIEDEPLVAMLIEDSLLEAGATSFAFAATEADAVREAREQRPDFITADATLREGRGPAAVDAIRAVLGPVPVVVISGDLSCERPSPPSCPVLQKPFRVAELQDCFRALAPL